MIRSKESGGDLIKEERDQLQKKTTPKKIKEERDQQYYQQQHQQQYGTFHPSGSHQTAIAFPQPTPPPGTLPPTSAPPFHGAPPPTTYCARGYQAILGMKLKPPTEMEKNHRREIFRSKESGGDMIKEERDQLQKKTTPLKKKEERDQQYYQQQHQQQYGTFHPSGSHQTVIRFPQPTPPSGTLPPPSTPPFHGAPPPTTYFARGHQAILGYVGFAEGTPVTLRQSRLPCCGIGFGWFLFIIGFFLAAVPWYVGASLLLFSRLDSREEPGYVACTIAAVVSAIAVVLGVTKGT